jgi:hypothetical protein
MPVEEALPRKHQVKHSMMRVSFESRDCLLLHQDLDTEHLVDGGKLATIFAFFLAYHRKTQESRII